MRVADYIMARLQDAGIDHIFMVTGRGALFLTDAVAKHSELNGICVHHEQSAAFAAVAYAQQRESIGACLVSTGCASTNAITGVLNAWQDAIPCIFISGQNILSETSSYTGLPLRTYGQQEADIVSLVKPITKYAAMITSAEQIVSAMDTALASALEGRKGPVWIDVPLDLQSAQIDPPAWLKIPDTSESLPKATFDEIESLVSSLRKSFRPVLLIGSGIKSAGAEYLLRELIEKHPIPLTYTAAAVDTYGSAESMSIGSVGSMGCSRAGNFAVQNADLIIVLGSRLSSLTTGPDFEKFGRHAKIIVIDIDSMEHRKLGIRIDQLIQADVLDVLNWLINAELNVNWSSWIDQCQRWKVTFQAIEPHFVCTDRTDLYQLADALSKTLPEQSTVLTDSGLAEVILPTNIRFNRHMRCIHPSSQGSMGFALPAAIGAYHARQQTTVAVIGDGSIMMNLQELESIRHQKLPIKIIVINNNVYSIIRRRQQDLFRKRTIGTDSANGVSCPDFSKVADCFGLHFLKIENPSHLDHDLKSILAYPGSVLCEIMGREDQDYIEIGHARRNIDKRLVRRPLEDQLPFLDRDIFQSLMIVEPIDQ
jgi:acetolactate synthase-1/2/3 large subunit